ncbi:MAG: hypothetical protein HKN28_12900 [Alphaproteobacteria bacterium]|nr:hypothetical protein [Alphaproteobacteria bacterium]
MSRLLSWFIEYINIITGILVIMSIAGLVALVVNEPADSDSLVFVALIVLISLTVINCFIAAFVSMKRHLVDIRTEKARQMELLRAIASLNAASEIEAQKRADMKYPPTNY